MKTEDVIEKHFKELQLIYKALLEDVLKHSEKIKAEPQSAVWRRSSVRATFAFIEGTASSMRRYLVFLCMVRKDDLASMEDAELLFESYRIPTGSANKKRKHLSFADSIKKTLNLLARACRINFDVGRHSQDWENFLEAVMIRDRLTHPKEPRDLIVSDTELVKATNAGKWFIDAFSQILNDRQLKVGNQ